MAAGKQVMEEISRFYISVYLKEAACILLQLKDYV
jgi:hypothetical protein